MRGRRAFFSLDLAQLILFPCLEVRAVSGRQVAVVVDAVNGAERVVVGILLKVRFCRERRLVVHRVEGLHKTIQNGGASLRRPVLCFLSARVAFQDLVVMISGTTGVELVLHGFGGRGEACRLEVWKPTPTVSQSELALDCPDGLQRLKGDGVDRRFI